MALFKISKGLKSRLPTTYVEGYCYFTTDDGKFYIDTSNTASGRVCLNAYQADTVPHALISNGTKSTETKGQSWGTVGVSSGNRIYSKCCVNLNNGQTTLSDGMIIAVKLPVSGNSSGYCISIDKGTTYHPMVHTNNSIITTHFNQNTILLLMYDGSTKASVYGSSSGATSTSSQNITGVWRVMNSREDGNTYTSAYCSTVATTAAKTATSHGYVINNNQKHYIHIIITNTNTAQSALTLNINGQGAKPIYINGTASSSSNYNLTRGSYLAYYDGTNYHFRTDGKLQGSLAGNADTATKATQDSTGQQINTTYIKGLSVSGRTITYTKGDGSTGTIATQDLNTRQTLYSNNYNLPLLMSYQTNTNTTANIDNITFRNNSIYANPSTGMIASTSNKIGEHVILQYDSTNECLNFVFT